MSEYSEVFTNAVKGAGLLAIQGALNVILGAFLFIYMAQVLTAKELGVCAAVGIVVVVATCTFLMAMATSFNLILIPLYLIIALISYAIFFPLIHAVNLKDVHFIAEAIPLGSKVLNFSTRIRSLRSLYQLAKRLLHA